MCPQATQRARMLEEFRALQQAVEYTERHMPVDADVPERLVGFLQRLGDAAAARGLVQATGLALDPLAGTIAAMAATPGGTRWFAMLDTGAPPAEWNRLARELVTLTGADVDTPPHLTAGVGEGETETDAVAAAFARADAPRASLRLCPPVAYHEGTGLHFRWAVVVAVERDEQLRRWHERAQGALRAAGLDAPERAGGWTPHVTALRGSERLPALDPDVRRQAVALLEAGATALRLPVVRLRVSRLVDGRFDTVFERVLD